MRGRRRLRGKRKKGKRLGKRESGEGGKKEENKAEKVKREERVDKAEKQEIKKENLSSLQANSKNAVVIIDNTENFNKMSFLK